MDSNYSQLSALFNNSPKLKNRRITISISDKLYQELKNESFDKSYTKMSEYVKHIVIGRSETKSD